MSEPKFKVGDVVRHRLSGKERVVVEVSDGMPLSDYPIRMYGLHDGTTRNAMLQEDADVCCERVGHIADARWDGPPKGIDAGRNDSRMVGNVIACPPDPALPRRFRWKYDSPHIACRGTGVGVFWNDKGEWVYQFGANGDPQRDGLPNGYTITEWIDPKPEGVV